MAIVRLDLKEKQIYVLNAIVVLNNGELKMSNYFERPTIYVSHPIRGRNGDMKDNCKKAINGVRKLRKLFPEIDFYVPAEGDLVLQILYNSNKLSERNILWADKEVLRNCHGWFFYKFDESSGSEIERAEAIKCGFVEDTEHDIIYDISKANFNKIRRSFIPIVELAIKEFRR
jgi:hypothetical protein